MYTETNYRDGKAERKNPSKVSDVTVSETVCLLLSGVETTEHQDAASGRQEKTEMWAARAFKGCCCRRIPSCHPGK